MQPDTVKEDEDGPAPVRPRLSGRQPLRGTRNRRALCGLESSTHHARLESGKLGASLILGR